MKFLTGLKLGVLAIFASLLCAGPAAAHDLVICKVSRSGIVGNFTFMVRRLPSGTPYAVVVPSNNCVNLGPQGDGALFEISEVVPTGVQVARIDVDPTGERLTCSAAAANKVCVHITEGHDTVVTFVNEPVIISVTCVLTKGYYRNHATAVSTLVAGAGGTLNVGGKDLTASQAQAILSATPGKRGNVSFSPNLLLNLAQQLITTLLNVHGSIGVAPAAVQTAFAQAQAGMHVAVAGSSIQITSTLSQSQTGALVDVFSKFNEGQFAGFPHCDD